MYACATAPYLWGEAAGTAFHYCFACERCCSASRALLGFARPGAKAGPSALASQVMWGFAGAFYILFRREQETKEVGRRPPPPPSLAAATRCPP